MPEYRLIVVQPSRLHSAGETPAPQNETLPRFEHYDMPGLKLDGDVHLAGKMKIAWFKDPDGNILNVVNG